MEMQYLEICVRPDASDFTETTEHANYINECILKDDSNIDLSYADIFGLYDDEDCVAKTGTENGIGDTVSNSEELQNDEDLNIGIDLEDELECFDELYSTCRVLVVGNCDSDPTQNSQNSSASEKKLESEDVYPCTNCQLTFTTNNFLQQHLQYCRKKSTVVVNKKHKCDQCSFQSDNSHVLKIHKRTHTAEKRFTCEICKKGFNRCDTFRHHMYVHKNQKKPFQCNKCDYSAISRSHLKSHIGYKHSTEKPLKCVVCNYKCVNSTSLKSHMLTHKTEVVLNVERLKCSYCDYSTTRRRKRDLTEHVQRKHTTDRPFQCEACDYKGVTAPALKQHTINKHSKDKLYKCTSCTYQTMSRNDYNQHRNRKHASLLDSGKEVLKCDECDFSTVYKSSLKNHKKARHSAEKPFQCDSCEYKCATLEYLKRHVHKSYKCSNCRYKALTAERLMQHFQDNHMQQ